MIWIFSLTLLGISFFLLFIAKRLSTNPGEIIKFLYSYNTNRTLSNPEAMDKANRHSGKNMVFMSKAAIILSAISLIVSIVTGDSIPSIVLVSICGVWIVFSPFAGFIFTERYLNREFKEDKLKS